MGLFSRKSSDTLPPRRNVAPSGGTVRPAPADLQAYAFRRNRTLAGSSSSDVNSAGDHSYASMTSPRVEAHQLTHKRRRIVSILAGVLAASALIYIVLTQIIASVTVRPSGDISVQLDDYRPTIQRYLNEHPLDRLRMVLSTANLTNYLQRFHPEIQAVTLGPGLGIGSSEIILTLRTPIAGWSISGKQHYVDATGVAFTRNYSPDPAVQIVDESGLPVEAGQAVASNRFLGFVGRIVGISKSKGFEVTKVVIPRSTARQIQLQVRGVTYPIKMSVDRPAGEQVEDMVNTIQWMQKKGQTPQYIDVRVSGRAFYR